jgi:hypothetical protein
MKKHLLFITILVFLFKTGQGQTNVYHPFPADSANWAYRFSLSTGESIETAKWLGDTIINLKTYTKVFDPNGRVGIGFGAIGIRQDIPNEKIYCVNSSGVETDFSVSQHLLVGDTFPSFVFGGSLTVISVDSTLIVNKYHKVYTLQTGNTYIVGVGISHDSGFEFVSDLLCFNVGTPPIGYSLTPPFCTYVTSIKQIKNNITSQISPNPSSGIISIAGNINIDELKVTDMLGQIVYEAKPNTTNTTLTLTDAGVYFITLTSGTQTSTKKVIVSK